MTSSVFFLNDKLLRLVKLWLYKQRAFVPQRKIIRNYLYHHCNPVKKNSFILRKLEVLIGDRVFLVRVQVFLVRLQVFLVRVQVFLVRVRAQSESSTSPGFVVCRIHFHCEQTIQFLIFTYYTVNTVLTIDDYLHVAQYSMYTLFCCPNLCLILIN